MKRSRLSVFMVLILLLSGLSVSLAGEGKIDLNQATKEQLMSVKGIGEKKAEAILNYRKEFGPFENLADLTNVKGFGAKTVQKLEAFLIAKPLPKTDEGEKAKNTSGG